jgi:mRNA interferase RelE/StbE
MYIVEFTPQGERSLAKLEKNISQRVLNKIKWLAGNLDLLTPELLAGKFSKLYKLRVGGWRVIYDIDTDNRTIIIHLVGHRGEIYRTQFP